jgi:NAD(P)-dependent dehydrogenase (short-subunit alcohol dehydrogenase family)
MAKTVLITGSSSGFGKDAALLFQSRGWNVAATMRMPEKAVEWARLPRLITPRLDVLDGESIESAVAQTVETFGSLDVLINNAGYGLFGPLEGITSEQWHRQVGTNLTGATDVTRAVLPHMRAQGKGVIVNVSSVAGRLTFPLASAYHATKWGLEGLTESLQYELKPFGIRVKLVEPGAVKTDFNTRSLDFATHPAYQGLVDWARDHFERSAKSAPEPAKTVETIYLAATDGTPKLRYPVHAQPILTIRKLLPDAAWFGLMGLAVGYAVRKPKKLKT